MRRKYVGLIIFQSIILPTLSRIPLMARFHTANCGFRKVRLNASGLTITKRRGRSATVQMLGKEKCLSGHACATPLTTYASRFCMLASASPLLAYFRYTFKPNLVAVIYFSIFRHVSFEMSVMFYTHVMPYVAAFHTLIYGSASSS